MIILGMTGSIGMGKSTTASMFIKHGVPVYDADSVVHELYKKGPVVDSIEKLFPGTTGPYGLDRKKLSTLVFTEKEALSKLEAIVHPYVRKAEKKFIEEHEKAGFPLVVLDIPLLFETGADRRVDKILVVTAPFAVQRERVLSRENMTEKKFIKILEKQISDAEKRKQADFILDTSHGFDTAEQEVCKIINQLIHS